MDLQRNTFEIPISLPNPGLDAEPAMLKFSFREGNEYADLTTPDNKVYSVHREHLISLGLLAKPLTYRIDSSPYSLGTKRYV